jgi:hypothetical protein
MMMGMYVCSHWAGRLFVEKKIGKILGWKIFMVFHENFKLNYTTWKNAERKKFIVKFMNFDVDFF